MSLAIFAFGIIVFLITVYGTVVIGGMFLTDRQVDEEPDIAPDELGDVTDGDTVERVKRLVNAEF